MDPADVEVTIKVGDDGLAEIQTNPAIPYVLPSVEDHFDQNPFVASVSTSAKRKRHPAESIDPFAVSISTGAKRKRHPAEESIAPSPWYLASVYGNPLYSTPAVHESRLTRLGTEETEESEWFPPPKYQLSSGSMAPLQPRELPGSPPKTNPNSRVWESHRPSSLNFTIYEDPQDQQTPSPPQQGFYSMEEDKENIFLTQSDLETSDEEEQDTPSNLAWNEASTGPRDAFGLPLNREMSDFVPPRNTPFTERPMRHGREVLRTLWVDEAQVPEEDDSELHEESLTNAQVREAVQTRGSYQLGRAMARSNLYQLREDTRVQAPTYFPRDVRRILDFQQPEYRRSITPEPNEDSRTTTPEKSEEEGHSEPEQELE
ncbi:hypothetical protein CBS147355_8594 [Penicillium roqueforti]|nr:hypothetical protein CBS147355_8594 [Penicillium roqueforti]